MTVTCCSDAVTTIPSVLLGHDLVASPSMFLYSFEPTGLGKHNYTVDGSFFSDLVFLDETYPLLPAIRSLCFHTKMSLYHFALANKV